jgi:serine/threonine protein phosphatase 1
MLKNFSRNTIGRDFAVGDIHGYFSELTRGLNAIGFDPRCDRLFSLGDMVDRGPESAQVLEWLAKPWFFAVRGNHEMMACAAFYGVEATKSCHIHNGGQWLHNLTSAEGERITDALINLPVLIELETANGQVGMVHADLPYDDWQAMRKSLTHDEVEYCTWSVERYRRKYTGVVRGIRAVVHGHMRVARMTVLGNAYFIDTHCGGGAHGHFTFLNLSTLKEHRGPGGDYKPIKRRYW